jgi:hypothetical protein
MTIKTLVPIVALACVLSACASDPRNANQMAFEDALNFASLSEQRMAKGYEELAGLSDEDVRQRLVEKLSDVTAIVKQTGHGIYVEYTAPDGRLFMWYPGNGGTVTGTWGISENFSPPRACFKYFGAYHGVTGEFEPNECVATAQTLSGAYVVDSRPGDVFALSTKGIPYSKSAGNLPPWPESWQDFE